jgi:hypothetical protein
MDSTKGDVTELLDAGETSEGELLPRYSPQALARYAMRRVRAWNEQRFARRAARLARAEFQRLRAERPELQREDLYAAFVCRRNAVDDAAARRILQRAEQSFAVWPDYRDLMLQDVVKYVVISDYMASHRRRGGTIINMGQVIGRVIPRSW